MAEQYRYAYCRPSIAEVEAELERRLTKEHKIDYLRWLLTQDEEAHQVRPDEVDYFERNPHDRLGIDEAGKRSTFVDMDASYEPFDPYTMQKWRTRLYREFVSRRLTYWEKALTEEGPDLPQSGPDAQPVVFDKPLVHYKKRDQFAHLIGLIYETYFKQGNVKSCTKKALFQRVAPLFAHYESPEAAYTGVQLNNAESRARLTAEEEALNKSIISKSLRPPGAS